MSELKPFKLSNTQASHKQLPSLKLSGMNNNAAECSFFFFFLEGAQCASGATIETVL